ncbi:MAG TPA: C13 family peptidase [Steroidobacteraceae bacterium]|nr:C13 family peptidase [Steroidobacteraceae bacterium]
MMDAIRVATQLTPQDWDAVRSASLRRGHAAAFGEQNPLAGPCLYEFDAAGVRLSCADRHLSSSWDGISQIERVGERLILWPAVAAALPLPVFPPAPGPGGGPSAEDLERELRAMQERARAHAPHWIALVPRLWGLRGAADIPRRTTDSAVLALVLVSLALWIGLDYGRVGPGARLEPLAIPIFALYAFLVVGMAFLLSRSARPRADYRGTLFSIVTLLPVVISAAFMIEVYLDGAVARAGWALLCLYALLYSWQALRALTGRGQVRSLLIALAGFGVLYALGQNTDLSPWLWTPPASTVQDGDDAEMSPSVAESLLFDQQALIDDVVDAMRPGMGGSPAVYFVGFAGVAEQRVFAEEIKLAARVVDDRFSTADRQLLLINDRRDLDTYPIATASGLDYALRAIAQKMQPDRDILFLALSSHGSPDPELEVSNGSLPLEQISEQDLETALRDSGIQRRIIVISACYAGGFIQSLENPDTIVIAAAAADRTSFGCSDDRDMTYFGEAFYRDALPGARTLQEAFAKAKASIAQREQREHETPSEPQAFFGREISAVLERNPMSVEPHGVGLHARAPRPAAGGRVLSAARQPAW